MSKKRIVLSLSGGMDSTALLSHLLSVDMEVVPFSFSYGSKHNAYENVAARAVAKHYGLELREVDLSGVMKGFRSNLLADGGDIPEGHYEAESMKLTVVPCRNLIFLAVLAGHAESLGCQAVALGVHKGDHHIYPDCRPEFMWAAGSAVTRATDDKVILLAPFLNSDKAEICSIGLAHGAPFHLTRTCYKQQEIACGKCGSCQERREAFAKNGAQDPLPYEQAARSCPLPRGVTR